MYIQITTRCNMKCAHCCYSSTSDGEDMSFDMFKMILDKWGKQMAELDNNLIILGGGEPTIHPDFWKMIMYSTSYGIPWVATNGKLTEDALLLADLGKKGKVSSVLSLDKWHEPIAQKVIDAFKEGLVENKDHPWCAWQTPDVATQGRREIRSVKVPFKRGRAKEGTDTCACQVIRVMPNGLIYGCGCDGAPIIGTVKNGIFDRFHGVPWFNTCSLKWEYSN